MFGVEQYLLDANRLAGFGRLSVLQFLDDLLLLDEEGANDTLPDALVAQHSSVRTANGLLALGQATSLGWTSGPDSVQLLLALAALWNITTLLHVLVDQTAAGRTNTAKWKDDKQLISENQTSHIPTRKHFKCKQSAELAF